MRWGRLKYALLSGRGGSRADLLVRSLPPPQANRRKPVSSNGDLPQRGMPNQVKRAVAERSQVRGWKWLPSSASPSDMLLRRIAILLFILVAGLLTVFGYYASSICITVVLAGFLAILFDPVVVTLEKLHLPRGVARRASYSQA